MCLLSKALLVLVIIVLNIAIGISDRLASRRIIILSRIAFDVANYVQTSVTSFILVLSYPCAPFMLEFEGEKQVKPVIRSR